MISSRNSMKAGRRNRREGRQKRNRKGKYEGEMGKE